MYFICTSISFSAPLIPFPVHMLCFFSVLLAFFSHHVYFCNMYIYINVWPPVFLVSIESEISLRLPKPFLAYARVGNSSTTSQMARVSARFEIEG